MYDIELIKELDERYHFKTYKRAGILLVEGNGSRVWDSEGREYIDLLAGIAVNGLGHCHPKVVSAIRDQSSKLMHCSNIYYIGPQALLAQALIENCDMDRIFFGNSGTEAVEGAIKLARKWASNNRPGGKIITVEGSFHGRSLAAITATGQEKYRKGFDPLPEGFEIVPFNDLQAVKDAVDEKTCAVMVEPVQGEGGIRVADPEYLKGLRELCDEEGILLIFDEIQCGMGRTGHFFAYQGYGVVPDIITIAKALGAGFPIGALLAKEEVADNFGPGDHGTTFGGNPLACAAALASISTILEEELPDRSKRMGYMARELLRERTKGHPWVLEIRGRGLMIGIELKKKGKEIVNEMMEKGVLANCTAGNVIRFVPPLNIPEKDLKKGIDVFVQCLKEASSDDEQS
ncbi:MAG: aspartate aminotransferase family protein [Thermoplasmatota archaeon]